MCRSNSKTRTVWPQAAACAIAVALLTLPPYSSARAQDERVMAQIEQLYQQQRFEELVDLLTERERSGLEHAHGWLRLGNALDHLGRLDEALAAYRQAAAMPVPPSHNLGHLQARRTRGKALLNLARVNLTLARSALLAFQENGQPDASQLEVQQFEAAVRREWDSNRSSALQASRLTRLAPPHRSGPPERAVAAARSAAIDADVVIEYRSGGRSAEKRSQGAQAPIQ